LQGAFVERRKEKKEQGVELMNILFEVWVCNKGERVAVKGLQENSPLKREKRQRG